MGITEPICASQTLHKYLSQQESYTELAFHVKRLNDHCIANGEDATSLTQLRPLASKTTTCKAQRQQTIQYCSLLQVCQDPIHAYLSMSKFSCAGA